MFSIYVDTTIINRIPLEKCTGVHRVVKNIAASLIAVFPNVDFLQFYTDSPPTTNNRFREITQRLERNSLGEDREITLKSGDILFLLDNSIFYLADFKPIFIKFKSEGLTIVPIVHDVIPLTYPHYVNKDFTDIFKRWLDSISEICTGVISVSKTTQEELLKIKPSLKIKSFHLGKNIEAINSNCHIIGMPKGKTVLMVGTIEPRKCYSETLDAFEKIWETEPDINLVITGRVGWLSENLVKRISYHPRLNKTLFVLNDASDSDLIYLYKNADLFLFSSDAEGFGIPLVEAASYGMQLLLRDRAIFREIAGDNATYFNDFKELPTLVTSILRNGTLKVSGNIKTNTWEDSALECVNHLLKFRMEHLRALKLIV